MPFVDMMREVVALGELHRLEQRHEALLLDEQDRAEAMLRPERRKARFVGRRYAAPRPS